MGYLEQPRFWNAAAEILWRGSPEGLLREVKEIERLILTVVQGNDAAIALYRRHGFTIYGVEPRARKTAAGYTDKVLMACDLRGGEAE